MTPVHRITISVDKKIFEEFQKLAESKGIKVSTWLNLQMKQFIERESKNK